MSPVRVRIIFLPPVTISASVIDDVTVPVRAADALASFHDTAVAPVSNATGRPVSSVLSNGCYGFGELSIYSWQDGMF